VENNAAYLVTGVDADGFRHVLGIWLGAAEGSRFWGGVLAELRNRGIREVLFVCCDGLNGLPEAIEATWGKAIVQTCDSTGSSKTPLTKPSPSPHGAASASPPSRSSPPCCPWPPTSARSAPGVPGVPRDRARITRRARRRRTSLRDYLPDG
jgi:hypothetical protein